MTQNAEQKPRGWSERLAPHNNWAAVIISRINFAVKIHKQHYIYTYAYKIY